MSIVVAPPAGVRTEVEFRTEWPPAARTAEPDGDWNGIRIEPTLVERDDELGVECHLFKGLDPAAYYRYRCRDLASGRVLDDSAGRARSLPVDGQQTHRIVLVSCNKQDVSPADYERLWNALGDLLDDDDSVRLVVHCGDQAYNDRVWDRISDAGLRRPLPERAAWIERNRERWPGAYLRTYETAWSSPAARRVLRSVPSWMTWDDHDIHDGYGSRSTDTGPIQSAIAAAAFRAFDTVQAPLNPQYRLGTGNRGFWAKAFGGLLVCLDTRSHRVARRRAILDERQWSGLEKILAGWDDGAGPLFLVSSTPVFNPLLETGWWKELIRAIGGVSELGDDLRDAWGHKKNRAELSRLLVALDAARARASRPIVVLSGDIHIHHRSLWHNAERPSPAIHQVVSSPFTNRPLGHLGRDVAYRHVLGREFRLHPELPFRGAVHWMANRRGFAVIRIGSSEPEPVAVRFFLDDRSGNVAPTGAWDSLA